MGSGGALASQLVQNNRSDDGTVRSGYEFCRANGHVQPLHEANDEMKVSTAKVGHNESNVWWLQEAVLDVSKIIKCE